MEETRRTVPFGGNIRSLFRLKKKENSCFLFARKGMHEEKKCAFLFVSLESFIANIKNPTKKVGRSKQLLYRSIKVPNGKDRHSY
jgi:hypothetical protein